MALTTAMPASFVVYPPPSHILRQDILRARKRDPPPRERTDRRTGTTRPSLARAGSHVSKNPVALFGNRIGPGFPRPLSRHTKQTIPTYRTRGPRRAAAPTPLPERKHVVCSSIPSKSRYALCRCTSSKQGESPELNCEAGSGPIWGRLTRCDYYCSSAALHWSEPSSPRRLWWRRALIRWVQVLLQLGQQQLPTATQRPPCAALWPCSTTNLLPMRSKS